MSRLLLVLAALVGLAGPVRAQTAVAPVPDWASYATAAANPSIAVWHAVRSDDRWCQLGQLGVSALVTTGVGLTAQHFIVSPRPCVGSPGCSGNGGPSMHAAIGVLGISKGFRSGLGVTVSVTLAVGTAGARVDAERHTVTQAAAGVALGALAEWAGHALVRCEGHS